MNEIRNGQIINIRVAPGRMVRARGGEWMQGGQIARVRADAYWRKALADGDVDLFTAETDSQGKPPLKAVKTNPTPAAPGKD